MAERLPHVLAEVAAVAGYDAALKLAEARGGTQIYLPPEPDADHWLSQLLGVAAARAIADRLTCGVGGMRIDLPVGPANPQAARRAEVDRLLREGWSERDIALATRYTIRGIRRRRAALQALDGQERSAHHDNQLSLF